MIAAAQPEGPRDLPGPAVLAKHHPRISVSESIADGRSVTGAVGPVSDVLVGRLVHRLLQFEPMPESLAVVADRISLKARAAALLDAGERASVEDPDEAVERAVEAWRILCARPDVVGLLRDGRPRYEVPFSFHDPASQRILRGTIDCLVRRSDGSVTVVEFKTGAPRPAHELQLSVYVRAASRLFPTANVDGVLVYS